ncbi:cytidine deaminase [Nostoc sp. TCL26-01]|uniref:cytidine deaminase n=1 Tax=Nostoc sp. TCL26-01 TaxID=2576904 RepID=UPI0015B83607|nr:cytidine deaminase [Nostoc sp. TCL26-01]QLE58584.1 cytidine deaminase [Nostoc sp. TCL26-01]
MLSDEEKNLLFQEAAKASKNSYSPYSNYPVGASVITDSGKIYSACNVENASYSLTICAERVAISKAIADGDCNLKAIAIFSPHGDLSPCGACRQFIIEFGKEIETIYQINGTLKSKKIQELIPDSFTTENLQW